MIATLRTVSPNGESQELSRCSGKGEIYWPYIRLEPFPELSRSTTGVSTRTNHIINEN